MVPGILRSPVTRSSTWSRSQTSTKFSSAFLTSHALPPFSSSILCVLCREHTYCECGRYGVHPTLLKGQASCRLVVVGGGCIGAEQASIFNNFGTEVHLIVRQVCVRVSRAIFKFSIIRRSNVFPYENLRRCCCSRSSSVTTSLAGQGESWVVTML